MNPHPLWPPYFAGRRWPARTLPRCIRPGCRVPHRSVPGGPPRPRLSGKQVWGLSTVCPIFSSTTAQSARPCQLALSPLHLPEPRPVHSADWRPSNLRHPGSGFHRSSSGLSVPVLEPPPPRGTDVQRPLTSRRFHCKCSDSWRGRAGAGGWRRTERDGETTHLSDAGGPSPSLPGTSPPI